MLAVSLSSTKKVLSPKKEKHNNQSSLAPEVSATAALPCMINMFVIIPAMIRSEAPSLVKTLSTGVKLRLSAGTKHPS